MNGLRDNETREEFGAVDFSVVVPVYRGRETLDELCGQLIRFFERRGASFEIILVDDASTDGSWEKVRDLAAGVPQVKGIRLMRNFGQHNATNCGLSHAIGDWVVTMDEDLQHGPGDIEKLIDCQRRTDADVVYGVPGKRYHPAWHNLVSKILMRVPRRVTGVDFDITSFRLIRGSVARLLKGATRHDILIDIYLAWTTRSVAAVRVDHAPARKTGYTLHARAGQVIDLICNYTIVPLRFAAILGAFVSVVSFLFGIVFIVLKMLFEITMPGFTAIIVTLFFSTGLILLAIGIVSEYLARVFLQVGRKPQWIVREATFEDRPVEMVRRGPDQVSDLR